MANSTCQYQKQAISILFAHGQKMAVLTKKTKFS